MKVGASIAQTLSMFVVRIESKSFLVLSAIISNYLFLCTQWSSSALRLLASRPAARRAALASVAGLAVCSFLLPSPKFGLGVAFGVAVGLAAAKSGGINWRSFTRRQALTDYSRMKVCYNGSTPSYHERQRPQFYQS